METPKKTQNDTERPTKVEYRVTPDGTAEIRDATLFVDPKTDRIGIRVKSGSAPGSPEGRYQLPLSDVVELLRKTVL